MASTTKNQRWLDLIAFLAGHHWPVAFEEIMERVPPYASDWRDADAKARASVRRKFERDKDELRELGIPIETVDYSVNFGREQTQGYRLSSRDFYLPYVRLVSDEGHDQTARRPASSDFTLNETDARAALDALHRVAELPAFPLRREARSALRKLTFDLGPEGLGGGAGDAPVRYLAPPGSEDVRERLHLLSDALTRHKRVRFRYRGIQRDAVTQRQVDPYGLLFQHSHWYLIGHDVDREAVRVFRLGRMDPPEVNQDSPKSPDYEVPDDFTLADYADRPAWALAGQDDEPLDVRVRFEFPRSLWAERNRHGELVARNDDGSQLRRFPVQDPGPFLRWILSLGTDAHIVSPGGMRADLRTLAARVAGLHGAADDDGSPDSPEGEHG
jgi:proteasome accessory factor B